MHRLKAGTSQSAWELLNEWLFKREKKLTDLGQGRNGSCIIAYDVCVHIQKAWVDPNFDFHRCFNYQKAKWTSLIKNYVDLNYLDLIKASIEKREAKKQYNYNETFRFSNLHDSGKDCLISLTFSRRLNSDIPHLIFHTRATEVTKRLLWDFLLVQRLGEYVYGHNNFSMTYFAPQVYIQMESFLMYNIHRDIPSILKNKPKLEKVQAKTLETLEKFKVIDPESMSYRVFRRPARALQKADKDIAHKILAKDCQLQDVKIEYPDNIITEKDRKAYRKKLAKNGGVRTKSNNAHTESK